MTELDDCGVFNSILGGQTRHDFCEGILSYDIKKLLEPTKAAYSFESDIEKKKVYIWHPNSALCTYLSFNINH